MNPDDLPKDLAEKIKIAILRADLIDRCMEILDAVLVSKSRKQLANRILLHIDEMTAWPEGLV